MSTAVALDPNLTMREVLAQFPGAQRALFRQYHIGGCSSCGFQSEETLAEVCTRNGNLPVAEVIEHLESSRGADAAVQLAPAEVARLVKDGQAVLVDVRTREEFDAVQIEGSTFFTQELMHQLGGWDREKLIVFVCHHGIRSMDAVAYFAGHGQENVRNLRGGIDAWSQEVDATLPRYDLA